MSAKHARAWLAFLLMLFAIATLALWTVLEQRANEIDCKNHQTESC